MQEKYQQIIKDIKSILPNPEGTYHLSEPSFEGNEWKYIKECLDTGWVSSVGKFVDQFELKLVEYTGAKKAIVVSNGTAALHVSLILSGVEANDEVLTPALTFVATTNAIAYCGAIPHFVDSECTSLGIDFDALDEYLQLNTEMKNGECFNKNTKRKIKALILVHIFGHPALIEKAQRLCEKYNIAFIEDSTEGLGSFYQNSHVGTFGKFGVLSFNGNKIITTGGGGAILTNDEKLAKHAKHVTTTAKRSHPWEFYHDELAFNYRLPNLNSALGVAQLESIEKFVERRRNLAQRYKDLFKNHKQVSFIDEPSYGRSNFWLSAIRLKDANSQNRNLFIELAHKNNLMVRPIWVLQNKLPMYSNCPKMVLQNAEALEASVINLPSSVVV
ncbi:MAG: LegC family aminotransferase [Bacteriovoracaceae bacterium]